MKTREEIINDMCYTYRHDYGLDKDPNGPPWLSGMTPEERKGLYNTMAQIFDNSILPVMELKNGKSS
jgi:hypothetical protein